MSDAAVFGLVPRPPEIHKTHVYNSNKSVPPSRVVCCSHEKFYQATSFSRAMLKSWEEPGYEAVCLRFMFCYM